MKKIISIVIPTYNEEKNIKELLNQIELYTKDLDYDFEKIFIDNCSTDNTQSIIREICKKNKEVKAIFNNRNFGYTRSPYYGILQAKGDAVILCCADFQDPPKLIPDLIKKWENGSRVVLLKRTISNENYFLEKLKILFYKFIKLTSEVKLTERTSGSGLFDKKVIDELKKINDPYPYQRGLILEVIDEVDVLEFNRPKRIEGKSNSNFYNLIDVALLGIVKHSKIPLRFVTLFGFLASITSLIVGLFFLCYKLFYWYSFQLGFTPLIVGLFFGISFLVFMLGIIGEYIGFIFTQVRNLPLVFEKERINFD